MKKIVIRTIKITVKLLLRAVHEVSSGSYRIQSIEYETVAVCANGSE